MMKITNSWFSNNEMDGDMVSCILTLIGFVIVILICFLPFLVESRGSWGLSFDEDCWIWFAIMYGLLLFISLYIGAWKAEKLLKSIKRSVQ